MAKMNNREDMPKQAFVGKLKKGEKYHASVSPPGNQVEGHRDCFSFPVPLKMNLLRHHRQVAQIIK
jgi:hypothetical protein